MKGIIFLLCFFLLPLKTFTLESITSNYLPGKIILKVKDIDAFSTKMVHESLKATVQSKFKILQNHLVVSFDPSISVEQAISQYENDNNVIYAEPDYVFKAINSNYPNDERFNELWGMNNQKDSDIDAPEAWAMATGSADKVVAIIDTGIDYNHEDLKDNIWKNEGELGNDENGHPKENNGIDDDQNGYIDDVYGYDFANNDGDPLDDHSHGTHCAGTIGASGNNGIGVVGVSWNVKLMGVKFLSGSGSGSTEGAVKAIEYAIINKANIMSNSWGGGGPSETLSEVIKEANKNNILFVAAAGNDGVDNDTSPHYPSSYEHENVLAVAATNDEDQLASFSCYGGRSVDLAAPGVSILSTTPNNLYEKFSGTSMATPHVAGAAALLMSFAPELQAVEVKDRLMNTVDIIQQLQGKLVTSGRLNIFNLLRNYSPWPAPGDWVDVPHEISSPHNYSNNFDKTWTIFHEGANFIKLHFSKIDLEKHYDKIFIYDGNGNIVEKINGTYSNYWTYYVIGPTIKVRLKTDDSHVKYGFDIDKYSIVKH